MSQPVQSSSPHRKLAIVGLIAVILVAVTCLIVWLNRSSTSVTGPSDELIDKLMAARPDQRDDLIVELGRRGPQVIPQVTTAYAKAGNDPNLRTQLATVIFRTNAPAQAVPALEGLLQKEKDPELRRTIENYLAGLAIKR